MAPCFLRHSTGTSATSVIMAMHLLQHGQGVSILFNTTNLITIGAIADIALSQPRAPYSIATELRVCADEV